MYVNIRASRNLGFEDDRPKTPYLTPFGNRVIAFIFADGDRDVHAFFSGDREINQKTPRQNARSFSFR